QVQMKGSLENLYGGYQVNLRNILCILLLVTLFSGCTTYLENVQKITGASEEFKDNVGNTIVESDIIKESEKEVLRETIFQIQVLDLREETLGYQVAGAEIEVIVDGNKYSLTSTKEYDVLKTNVRLGDGGRQTGKIKVSKEGFKTNEYDFEFYPGATKDLQVMFEPTIK
ncbi:MAG: hypothetical protein Q7K42_01545, partial [Candidatus Diapherotrites archaeon]|nr:hypothetical protein [Candidatus Diapherotrites archaeon]